MKKIYLYLILIVTISALSCRKDTKEDSKVFDNLGKFDEIELKSAFEVFLTQDTVYKVIVAGNTKMIENISVEVENNILRLKDNNHNKWLNPRKNKIRIYIHSDKPKKVTSFETCNVQTTNPIESNEFGLVTGSKLNMANLELNNNIFYFWNVHPCGGKITLKGKSNTLKLWNFAIMTVDAHNLETKYCIVENHSKGDCTVFVNDFLEYSIYGEGDINLYGNPSQIVLHDQTSTGRLIKMN